MATCTDITKAFADRLSDLINKKKNEGAAIKEIAEKSGVPAGSISKYQNDAGEAGINSIVKLAKYFNVSTDYLLGLTDIPDGSAEDMAIEKRFGFNQATIGIFEGFFKRDGSKFLNLIIDREFWKILVGYQMAFYSNIIATLDEDDYKKGMSGDQRLMYTIMHSDKKPSLDDDVPGYNVHMDANEYLDYQLHKLSFEFVEFMYEIISDELPEYRKKSKDGTLQAFDFLGSPLDSFDDLAKLAQEDEDDE